MKSRFLLPAIFVVIFASSNAPAMVHYVNVNGTSPLTPYLGSADLITAQEIRPGFDHRNHLPLKSKSFLRHPSNLKFGQDFQLRLNQRFPRASGEFVWALKT